MATSAATVAMAGIFSTSTPSLNPSSSPAPSKFRPAFLPSIRSEQTLASSSSSSSPSSSSSSSSSRRALLGLLVASAPAALLAKDALAEASSIKVTGPPPPSGGLPGTENADQARDTDLPLKERFFIQPLPPSEATARAKDSAKDILGVKALIDKKAWPYVMNDLRLKASYLRYDLNTIIASKGKEEKKALKSLVTKLYDTIDNLDYAARSKSVPQAEKYYAETVSALNNVLAKLG